MPVPAPKFKIEIAVVLHYEPYEWIKEEAHVIGWANYCINGIFSRTTNVGTF